MDGWGQWRWSWRSIFTDGWDFVAVDACAWWEEAQKKKRTLEGEVRRFRRLLLLLQVRIGVRYPATTSTSPSIFYSLATPAMHKLETQLSWQRFVLQLDVWWLLYLTKTDPLASIHFTLSRTSIKEMLTHFSILVVHEVESCQTHGDNYRSSSPALSILFALVVLRYGVFSVLSVIFHDILGLSHFTLDVYFAAISS